jgi:hypothetical protein
MSGPSNMRNFTENSYNLEAPGNSWCVTPGSIYTNPNANFNYFSKKCGDPYTYYGYWYRRFPSQTKYLNCYYLPYQDVLLDNKWGYIRSKGNCVTNANDHYNKVSNGFKFYDSQVNPPTKRVYLSK